MNSKTEQQEDQLIAEATIVNGKSSVLRTSKRTLTVRVVHEKDEDR